MEGTLFVCQLSGERHPRYNVAVLNRKSMDNFITELVSEEDIEITAGAGRGWYAEYLWIVDLFKRVECAEY